MEAKLLGEPAEGFKYSKGTNLKMGNEGLVARIEAFDIDYGLVQSLEASARFAEYASKKNVSMAIAELYPRLLSLVKSAVENGSPLEFSYLGNAHIGLLLNRIQRIGVSILYCDINSFPEELKKAKLQMENNTHLYQICLRKNYKCIKEALEIEGFSTII